MKLSEQAIQEELASWIARYAGGAKRVCEAYASRRNRERDINWLALQATKEYGALVYHNGMMLKKTKDLAPLGSIRKPNQDSLEEAEHYIGYMEILNWYLNGAPCQVPEMWGYGDISPTFSPGPGMKQSLWPEHYAYFELGARFTSQARSDWMRQLILSNREGAAVGFHYVMSKLPPADEYMKRVAAHEWNVAEDELHHGSEMIPELARSFTSQEELEEAKRQVTDIHVQELRQRNEQFLHPLTADEMNALEQDFRAWKVEMIPIFSVVGAN
jgi:hypothetical protein